MSSFIDHVRFEVLPKTGRVIAKGLIAVFWVLIFVSIFLPGAVDYWTR